MQRKKLSPTNFLNKNEVINALKATLASAADHPHARPRLCLSALAGCLLPIVSNTQGNPHLFASSQQDDGTV
jgi:hypothetical protein